MFKLTVPMSLVLSSGSLMLLATVSLLMMSNIVHTSNIEELPEARAAIIESSSPVSTDSSVPTTRISDIEPANHRMSPKDGRRRDGRAYGQQSALDSYASAYAAANSVPSSSDQQTTVQAGDAIAYSSFGEAAPGTSSTGASGSSSARQLSSSEYGPHSSYYASYMSPSSNEISYTGQQANSGHYASPSHHHYQQSYYKVPISSAYPTGYDRQSVSGYYDRGHSGSSSTPLWSSSFGSGSGLMSSASSALSHWTSGFTISEIVCTVVAIAIGAVILGAPFFLIYLALMGNFSGSGTLSLTNPTQGATPAGGATTPANGRRKRLAIFEQISNGSNQKHAPELIALADAISQRLSPFVDVKQIANSFKTLINSIEKHSSTKQ